MSKVSSVRWNNDELFQRAKQFAALNNKKLNTIILEAIQEYLINHNEDEPMSELYRQTLQYSHTQQKNALDLESWATEQDHKDWKL